MQLFSLVTMSQNAVGSRVNYAKGVFGGCDRLGWCRERQLNGFVRVKAQAVQDDLCR